MNQLKFPIHQERKGGQRRTREECRKGRVMSEKENV